MHTCGISLLPTCIKRLPIGLASQVFRMTLLNLSPLLAYMHKETAHRLRKSGLSNDIAQPMGSLLSYIRLAINNDRFRGERGRITARRGYVERFCVSTLSPRI